MNRRNFLNLIAKAGACFSILPPANTYDRLWKATKGPLINPEWVNAKYEIAWYERLPHYIAKAQIEQDIKQEVLVWEKFLTKVDFPEDTGNIRIYERKLVECS